VFDRALGAGIRRVAVGERGQQRGDDRRDRPAVGEPAARLLQKEVGGLGVDVEIESYSASVVSTIGLRSTLPTVLTAMSTLPNTSIAAANSFSTLSGTVRSPWTLTAFAPDSCIWATVLSASASVAALL
jgi:hypothetical protein